jgi:hypothetical protein
MYEFRGTAEAVPFFCATELRLFMAEFFTQKLFFKRPANGSNETGFVVEDGEAKLISA